MSNPEPGSGISEYFRTMSPATFAVVKPADGWAFASIAPRLSVVIVGVPNTPVLVPVPE
jgi:hypothetical protein